MDNMTAYLTIAIIISALAAILGIFLNSWLAKKRVKHGKAFKPITTDKIVTSEPETSQLPTIPGRYGQLRLIKGGPPQIWTIEPPKVKIGRSIDMDIYLDSPIVSRKHAIIESRNGKFVISDCGSRNGTMVNGTKIDPEAELHNGDVIEIGPLKLIFSIIDIERRQ